MGKLDNKVAVITGGSEGIGLSIAEEFVKEGAFLLPDVVKYCSLRQ